VSLEKTLIRNWETQLCLPKILTPPQPGGGAPSIHDRVRELSSNLHATPLGPFCHWLRCMRPVGVSSDPMPDTISVEEMNPFDAGLVPCYLPRPPLEVAQARRKQNVRSRTHRSCTLTAWKWTEWLLAAISFLALGSPKSPKEYAHLGSWFVTGSQSFSAYRLFCRIKGQLRLAKPLEPAGHGLKRLLHILSTLDFYNSHLPDDNTHLSNSAIQNLISTQALPLDVHNAGLPEIAGTANPLDLLAPERAAEFRDVNSRVKDPPPDDSELPKPCYRVSRSSEAELRRATLKSGRPSSSPSSCGKVVILKQRRVGCCWAVCLGCRTQKN